MPAMGMWTLRRARGPSFLAPLLRTRGKSGEEVLLPPRALPRGSRGSFRRILAGRRGVENDPRRTAGGPDPGGVEEALLALEALAGVLGVEVDEIGGVDGPPDAQRRGLFADLAGRVEAHLDALDELDLQAVEPERLDALDRGQAGGGGGG